MRYEARAGGRVFAANCEGRDQAAELRLDPDAPALRWWRRESDGLYFLREGERTVAVRVVPGSGGTVFCYVGSDMVPVEVEDERELRLRAIGEVAGLDTAGGEEVPAPMPGRVVSTLVATGDAVEAGAPLVVVEAMKMENEVCAERGGKVVDVLVSEGDTVELGQVLVHLE